jgi:RNA polymerase sigma-70 factor (ECF subfamily)
MAPPPPLPDDSPVPAKADREALERMRAGDDGAFDTLFRAHYPDLVGFAESIVRERAAAEDVAQEVMLELWRRRLEIQPETSLRAYLFRATRNRALNQIRHQRVATRLEPEIIRSRPESAPPADHATVETELQHAVDEAIGSLPERCREVFELSRVEGLKYAEIAQVLDISVKTVEAQMGKALRVMREHLAQWMPGNTL